MVSRVHLMLESVGTGQWKLTDCQSLNGVYVNGVKVSQSLIRDGDEVVIGEGGKCSLGSFLSTTDPEFKFVCRLEAHPPSTSLLLKRTRDDLDAADGSLTEPLTKRPCRERYAEAEDLEHELAATAAELVEHRRQMAEAERQRREMESNDKMLQVERQKVEEAEQLRLRLEGKERQLEEEIDKLKQALAQREQEFTVCLTEQAERRREEEERLKREVEATKRLLEEERARLENEHHKREAVLMRERDELEKQRAELESQIAQKRREIEADKPRADGDTIPRTELEQEFLCVICHSIMVSAMMLECSHSFCSDCLDNWTLHKQACPMCRQPITRKPVRALNLDNIIEKIVQKMPEAERGEWLDRAQKLRKVEEDSRQLLTLIESAKKRGLRFLVIWDQWTEEEKKIFADGVERFFGKPRVLYCSTVGLTAQFIEACSEFQLATAARNLGLSDAPDLRKSVLSFIQKEEES